MQVLTEAGEVCAKAATLPQIIFRPSLAAMARIGTPAEIVELASRLFSGEATVYEALIVLWACTEDDATAYTGYFDQDSREYVRGAMSLEELGVIARHLLEHGLIGKTNKPRPRDGTSNSEFVAQEYAALAIAHLGASEREAWQMTMTTLINALHSKYPDIGKPEHASAAPSVAEHEATMAWFEQVEKMRG